MVRLRDQWPAYLASFMFFSFGVFGYADQDRPVRSTDQDEQRPAFIQGVAGRVTTPDGRPVKGAFIQPRSLDTPSTPIPEIAILSQDDGHYSWPLLPGAYEVSVSANGYQSSVKRLTVKTAQVVTVDFVLEHAR